MLGAVLWVVRVLNVIFANSARISLDRVIQSNETMCKVKMLILTYNCSLNNAETPKQEQ